MSQVRQCAFNELKMNKTIYKAHKKMQHKIVHIHSTLCTQVLLHAENTKTTTQQQQQTTMIYVTE